MMAVEDGGVRSAKRRRGRVTAELRDFRSFPSEEEQKEAFQGPFRENVKEFLSLYAWMSPPTPKMAGVPPQLVTWWLPFTVGAGEGETTVDLEVVAEDVARARTVHCDQCRLVGWSGNPVCAKRYHFIIRNDRKAAVRPHQKCVRCGSLLHGVRCTTCNLEMSEDDLEDWMYLLLEDNNHLLHAVVHSNGYGHLLKVNGKEGGSKFLRGRDVMNFWDRLCTMLRVRKVTVMDTAKKYGLEYRLLHAITTGRSWFGEWGYEFSTGSYAITSEAYKDAINTLSKLPISLFFSHSRSPRCQLQDVIAFYRSLSDQQLLTIGNIFHFMLQLTNETHELARSDSVTRKHLQAFCGILCAWTVEDVKIVEEAIVKVLRAVANGNWVSLRALKGALCYSIGTSELLDYCLMGLGGKLTGDGMIVAVRFNADAHSIEYRLQKALESPPNFQVLRRPSEENIIRDLKFLYDALLNPHTMHSYRPDATRALALKSATALLDCKRFIKNYDRFFPADTTNSLHIWCEIELIDQSKDHTVPPTELLVLPGTATIALLSLAATKAFREVYVSYQRFEVDKLVGYESFCDSTNVKFLIGKIGSVKVKGRCPSDSRLAQFRMERGTEKWVVDCLCGAEDDDGERMVACDKCGVWAHTRCIGVNDADEVPKKFLCMGCYGRHYSVAQVFGTSFRPPKVPKLINNEIMSRIHVNHRNMETHWAGRDSMATCDDNHKNLIKRCTETQDGVECCEFVPFTADVHSKTRHCHNEVLFKERPSLELTRGGDQSFKVEDGMDGIPPSTKVEDAIITTGTLQEDAYATKVDGVRRGSEWCNDASTDVNNNLTDSSGGRCKDGMTSPITEVGMYVTMTCK